MEISYVLSKESFSYISENENSRPEKTFLYFGNLDFMVAQASSFLIRPLSLIYHPSPNAVS